jgi:hypothetical protein
MGKVLLGIPGTGRLFESLRRGLGCSGPRFNRQIINHYISRYIWPRMHADVRGWEGGMSRAKARREAVERHTKWDFSQAFGIRAIRAIKGVSPAP